MDIEKHAHIIVINSKDNPDLNAAIAANLAVELMEEKHNVATVDLDGKDGVLSRFFNIRVQFEKNNKIWIKIPFHNAVLSEKKSDLSVFLQEADTKFDAVIIPSPSKKNNFKSEFFAADTLVTVLEDKTSLALLSEPEPSKNNILKPSAYTNFVWEIKKHLAVARKKALNWVVLPYQAAQIVEKQHNFLQEISKKYGFRLMPKILPRDIIFELMNEGLTLFDLNNPALKNKMNLSWLGAKLEYRNFAEFALNQADNSIYYKKKEKSYDNKNSRNKAV